MKVINKARMDKAQVLKEKDLLYKMSSEYVTKGVYSFQS